MDPDPEGQKHRDPLDADPDQEHCEIPIFFMYRIEDNIFLFVVLHTCHHKLMIVMVCWFSFELMASIFVWCSACRRGEGEDVGPEHAHQLQVQAKHRRHPGQVCKPHSHPFHQCFEIRSDLWIRIVMMPTRIPIPILMPIQNRVRI
jgi:hypothetical protein